MFFAIDADRLLAFRVAMSVKMRKIKHPEILFISILLYGIWFVSFFGFFGRGGGRYSYFV